MPNLSIHIGLNAVDPARYGGWDGQLLACEQDAMDMADIARRFGYGRRSLLLTTEATRNIVLSELDDAAMLCRVGDTFLLTYSGHGTRVPDQNGDESDACDEALVLYDGLLLDDELWTRLAAFRLGVRVILISDSCHSATQARLLSAAAVIPRGRIKAAPWSAARAYWDANADEHAMMQGVDHGDDAAAELIQLSACRDDQTALDGDRNGAFTEALLRAQPGAVDWEDLRSAVELRCPPSQTPVLTPYGASDAFMSSRPFALACEPSPAPVRIAF